MTRTARDCTKISCLVVTGAESITDALQVDDDTYVGARFKIRIGCTQKDDGAIYWDVRQFIPIGASADGRGVFSPSTQAEQERQRRPRQGVAACCFPRAGRTRVRARLTR